MELKPLTQIELDNFVSFQPHAQFLQSWSWGEFQKNVGHRVWRFGVYENNRLIAGASVIEHRLPLKKSYLYSPRGPVMDNRLADEQKEEALKLILSKVRDLTIATRQSEEIFFRLEPTFELKNSKVAPSGAEGPQIIKTKPIQPKNTLILDLQKSTEELSVAMHPKTRYNIHLAEKHGVKITKIPEADFEKCWPLFLETGKRDHFNLHAKNYYQKMMELGEMELWVAENNQGAIIAANLMSFFGDTATYLHGASDYHFRNLMAPHLLQWALIQETKNRGFKYYDFHGIAPEAKKQKSKKAKNNHPWAGITRFKMGFSGEIVNYPGTFDFIYEKGWYKLYQFLRKINRLL